MPPIHIPFFFEAAILSRMRSPMTSRSNCAKDNRMFRLRRPIDVVVLNCCVTETKDASLASRISTILAKSASERVGVCDSREKTSGDGGEPCDFEPEHFIDSTRRDVGEQPLERWPVHRRT